MRTIKSSMKNKKNFFKKTREQKHGFSLMEIIVTIGVLSIGLLSVMTLYADNLNRIFVIRSQATANALAQEGLELVRNYAEMTEDWDTDLVAANDYRVYANFPVISLPATLQRGQSYVLNEVSGQFTHGTGDATRFARKIVVEVENFDGETDVGGNDIDNDRKVISYVSWGGNVTVLNSTDCNASNKCIYAEMKLVRSE
jgi:prepilin-type N-terminal cleavage/methylation domain-containing protein